MSALHCDLLYASVEIFSLSRVSSFTVDVSTAAACATGSGGGSGVFIGLLRRLGVSFASAPSSRAPTSAGTMSRSSSSITSIGSPKAAHGFVKSGTWSSMSIAGRGFNSCRR